METEIRMFVTQELLRGQAIDSLSAEQSLLEAGIIDSVGLLHLANFIEQQYGVVVEDEDLVPENFESLDSIAHLVRTKRPASSAERTPEPTAGRHAP